MRLQISGYQYGEHIVEPYVEMIVKPSLEENLKPFNQDV
jgi:hypothetical protein